MNVRYFIVIIVLVLLSCKSNGKSGTETASKAAEPVGKDTLIEKDPAPGKDNPVLSEEPPSSQVLPNRVPSGVTEFLQAYLPAGYMVFDTAGGDLNKDSIRDLAVVLQALTADTADYESAGVRPVVLLLGQEAGTYRLAARNDQALYTEDSGGAMGDPFAGITLNNGYFSIEHAGGSAWRWTRITTFKYAPQDSSWYLHKDGGDYFHSLQPEKKQTKISTVKDFGKISFEEFSINQDDK